MSLHADVVGCRLICVILSVLMIIVLAVLVVAAEGLYGWKWGASPSLIHQACPHAEITSSIVRGLLAQLQLAGDRCTEK